jgi:hypothetical protein
MINDKWLMVNGQCYLGKLSKKLSIFNSHFSIKKPFTPQQNND